MKTYTVSWGLWPWQKITKVVGHFFCPENPAILIVDKESKERVFLPISGKRILVFSKENMELLEERQEEEKRNAGVN